MIASVRRNHPRALDPAIKSNNLLNNILAVREGQTERLGVFECERHGVHDGGDHHILVGRVLKASFDPHLDPLLFFRGSYRRLHFD